MSSKMTPATARLRAEVKRFKNLPSYPLEFGSEGVVILGKECPIKYTKHGHYVVELWGYKTVVCRGGMEIIQLRDSIEASTM